MNNDNLRQHIRKVKAWAVCFALNKKCLSGDIPTFTNKVKAQTYIEELHQKIGGFEGDHHIIKVLITKINANKRRN